MKQFTRRQFLGEASCAGMGYLTLMNTLINFKALNAAAIANSATAATGDYKAIVCLMKAGGNDSFNMLVPYDDTHYAEYSQTRGVGALAIEKTDLIPLNYNSGGREFGLNPSMSGIAQLFDEGKAAFISNIGTLLRPTTAQDYDDKYKLPRGLFSHSDQQQEWQTSLPDQRSFIGWGGRIADMIADMNSSELISMNMSLSGNNVFQSGNSSFVYSINRNNGASGIRNYDIESSSTRRKRRSEAINSFTAQQYTNVFEKSYMKTIANANMAQEELNAALATSVTFPEGSFPDTTLGGSLEMIARLINVRETLGFQRQIFFVEVEGWDNHSELINTQFNLLDNVSASVKAFADALETMESGVNLLDQVLTLNLSEFGRTLTWNGGGSDHAWGGNVWMVGGTSLLNGRNIYGQFPSLSLENNPQNVSSSRGRLIPTVSTDEYYAEVAKWFGVANSDLEYVLPNIGEFYDPYSSNFPIGFLNA